MVHIHVRYPETGKPSMELDHYAEVMHLIKAQNKELIINLTTGPGGRYVPTEGDPKVFAPGTTLCDPLKRVEHVAALKPEICSLDLNTMNSGADVVMNTRAGGLKVWEGDAWDDWTNDIGGPGKLTKSGIGWLRLSGDNTFNGAIVRDAAQLAPGQRLDLSPIAASTAASSLRSSARLRTWRCGWAARSCASLSLRRAWSTSHRQTSAPDCRKRSAMA